MIQRTLVSCLMAAALAVAAVPAHANQDAVSFGSNIHIPPGATVHDAVCFFCSVEVEGTVNHDIVVFFGSVHIAGSAEHDVVNFFGSVDADDNTAVGNDLVSLFGVVQLGENVSVGKDMVALFGAVDQANTVSVGNDRVIEPGWILLFPLTVVGFIVFAIVRGFREWRFRRCYPGYPFPPRM
jgi:hypothetical protein